MYCQQCGKELPDTAQFCDHCGYQIGTTPKQTIIDDKDEPTAGYAIIGFIVPIAGIILYLIMSNNHPRQAKAALKGALWAFVISFLAVVLISCAVGTTSYEDDYDDIDWEIDHAIVEVIDYQ